MSRWLRIPFILAIILAAALLVVLAAGGATSAAFERYFPVLLIVNSFATIALLAVIGAIVYRLIKQYRNKVFGARMTANLSVVLSLAAVIPCLLIYIVSSQFIGRSIDSWFDIRVEQALDSGVALSGEVIMREQHQLLQTARRIASIDVINKHFTINNMPVISSTYWNEVHGNTPEDVLQDKEGLQTMRNLGKNMAWALKLIDEGKKLDIAAPVPESGARTDFIR